ncbi:MAG: hypothetical protein AB7I48_22280 [Planctomycetaceae bacterium]
MQRVKNLFPAPCPRFASPYPRTRRGISIAEVVIASTLLTVLTTAGVTVLLLLMSAEQRAAEAVLVERTISDFAAELRRDAHEAADVQADGDSRLILTGDDDREVTYECAGDGVWRREQSGGEAVRQEKFHLPFGTSRFELMAERRLIVWRHEREIPVTMSLAEPTVGTEQPRRMFRIDAAVGFSRGLEVAAH